MQNSSGYSPIDEWNFAELDSDNELVGYFQITTKVLELLKKVYNLEQNQNKFELETISLFLRQLSNSLMALNLKYAYPTERGIWLDLSESGFPNQLEFSALEKDLETAAIKASNLPTSSILARSLLDTMMLEFKQPKELLKILGERTYLDYIQKEKLFLPYSGGKTLQYLKTTQNGILYDYSFACFDFATNRPYLNFITFEKDGKDEPITKELEEKFINAIKLEGYRAAPLAVMASSLDENLSSVHPKTIRRICLGPLYSRYMLNIFKENKNDETEMQIREIFSKYQDSRNDFILFFSEEFLFSKRQEVKQGGFLTSKKQLREIYEIDTLNQEAYERKVSKLYYNVLLSHNLLQNLSLDDQAKLRNFNQAKKYVYNDDEVVYGI